jgi:CBS domain-containing protein
MRIRDIMTAASCVRFDDPAQETLQKMQTVGADYAIVTRDKEIVGVVSRDELAFACAQRGDRSTGDVATAVPSLRPDAEIKDAANVMRSRGVTCVPVTEEETIAGIVTTDRLLELIGRGAIHVRQRRERRVLKDRGPKRKPKLSDASVRVTKHQTQTKPARGRRGR